MSSSISRSDFCITDPSMVGTLDHLRFGMFAFAHLVKMPHCNGPDSHSLLSYDHMFKTFDIVHDHGKSQLEPDEAVSGLARSSSGKSFAALTIGISKTVGASFSSLEVV